jgi:quinol monooxygenase YgiN
MGAGALNGQHRLALAAHDHGRSGRLPNVFAFELYADVDAYESHLETAHFKNLHPEQRTHEKKRRDVRLGSCVTSIAGPHGEAQLYWR